MNKLSGSSSPLEKDAKAYEPEQGQLLCHVYAADLKTEIPYDIVELIETEQCRSQTRAFRDWQVLNSPITGTNATGDNQFHVTLIRGHRVIYHHQIAPLLSCIESVVNSSLPLRLCFDKLKLFYNHEKTKQFLCIATRETSQAKEVLDLMKLKSRLRDAIDQFATRMTDEDESDDTLAHCSLMCRDVRRVEEPNVIMNDLEEIEKLFMHDYPICSVQIDTIYIKIGKLVYSFKLSES